MPKSRLETLKHVGKNNLEGQTGGEKAFERVPHCPQSFVQLSASSTHKFSREMKVFCDGNFKIYKLLPKQVKSIKDR